MKKETMVFSSGSHFELYSKLNGIYEVDSVLSRRYPIVTTQLIHKKSMKKEMGMFLNDSHLSYNRNWNGIHEVDSSRKVTLELRRRYPGELVIRTNISAIQK
ncbi:hypothetical protein CEXT_759421 [Caerostris extrusa]|uniref:Uncharacterized protein n=1 Tax=Caerostris extrusa TaxID=172846 RepID=A0AAV4PL94_CAEEX|nr:hypothetical protein CEXT_759421 [Caerostris extrusa]